VIKAVIFDFDGTLVKDLSINYEKLFDEFRKIMKTDNLHPITETVARLDKETKENVFKVWDREELAIVEKMEVNDEGMAIYDKYPKKPRGLVTMQGKSFITQALKILNLSFNLIVTREDSLNRVEQLKITMKKLLVDPANVLFVGNSENDLSAAEEANCQFLRVGN
jgi:phosphoglycolate phosphatase-like HAD superfamily hydrolase